MNQFTIVTEGEQDVTLLKAFLNVTDNPDDIKFVAAGGWSSADSLARSFLAHGNTKVALVVDADTIDPDLVADRKSFLKRSLGEISPSAMWKVFVIDPEIERLLFEDLNVVKDLVGHELKEAEIVSASFEPKAVLKRLLGRRSLTEAYSNTLQRADLSRIRQAYPIPDLLSFLKGAKPGSGEKRK